MLASGVAGFFLYYPLGNQAKNYKAAAVYTARAQLAEFTTNGVRVAVGLDSDSQGRLLLRATFTPVEHGFHIYSKDLDLKKTDGIGLPTSFDLMPHASLRVAGRVFSNVSPVSLEVKILNVTLPVYPDGPVVLRLPVEVDRADEDIAAQVTVTYMACKTDGECLFPVKKRIVDVKIPRSQLTAKEI